MKENQNTPLQQLAFRIDSQIKVPLHITDVIASGVEISRLVATQKIWKEKRNYIGEKTLPGLLCVQKNNSFEEYKINPGNFQIQEQLDTEHLVLNPTFNSAIVVADSKTVSDFPDIADRFTKLLIPGSPLMFVIDKNEISPNEINLIKNNLLSAELTNVEVRKNIAPNYILIEGRKTKIRKAPAPVNYLAKNSEGKDKYPWVKAKLSEIVINYELVGFKVIDLENSKIYEKLKSSKNYPKLISDLNSGFGVKLEGTCGCLWEINLSGTEFKLKDCKTGSCQGKPTYSADSNFNRMVKDISEPVKTGENCFTCGETLELNRRLKKKYGSKGASFSYDYSCPHCGSVDQQDKYLLTEEITRVWAKLKSEALSKE